MTKLSQTLKKFYIRTGNRVFFDNQVPLNDLALKIWEKLGYKAIDSSVLSRVISGERLFTVSQLNTFCDVLQLTKEDRDFLNHSLSLDYLARYGIDLDSNYLPINDFVDLFDQYITKATNDLNKGRYNEILNFLYPIQQKIQSLITKVRSETLRDKLLNQLGNILYLNGFVISSFESPNTSVMKTKPLAKRLFSIASMTKNGLLNSYGYGILANTYYASGNYLKNSKSRTLYLLSILSAKKSYLNIPYSNRERLMVNSIHLLNLAYLGEKDSFNKLKSEALENYNRLFDKDYLLGLNLFSKLARGVAHLNLGDPFKIKQQFKNLDEGNIFEVSDVRSDLEIYAILKIKGDRNLRLRTKRALRIAQEQNSTRHIKGIKRFYRKLFH